jgi:hypothetical protein
MFVVASPVKMTENDINAAQDIFFMIGIFLKIGVYAMIFNIAACIIDCRNLGKNNNDNISVIDSSPIDNNMASFFVISPVINGRVGLFILSTSISNKSFRIILEDMINNVLKVATIKDFV